MKKSDIQSLPEYYGTYINLCGDMELMVSFEKSLDQIGTLDIEQIQRIGLRTYAEGKWTLNTLLQHITDWERIWCYRTLVFARLERSSIPPGHDENVMAENSNASELNIIEIVDELKTVRRATIAMFNSFDDQILKRNCNFSTNQMSVLAMGFNIVGHQLHHFNIITERYLPLDPVRSLENT